MRPMTRPDEPFHDDPVPHPDEHSGFRVPATDLVAFVVALAMAWYFRWQARDLIWSLWLSSVVFGYATILSLAFRGHTLAGPASGAKSSASARLPGFAVVAGAVFFSLHFGIFSLVHSGFLAFLFPLDHADTGPSLSLYGEVVRRYWPFIVVTLVADGRHLLRPPTGATALLPYRNVLRMHLLILLFGFLFFLGIENFLAYALIYAFYFAPWERLLTRGSTTPGSRVPSA